MATIGTLALKLFATSDQLKTDLARSAAMVDTFATRVGGSLSNVLTGANPFGELTKLGEAAIGGLLGKIPGIGPALSAGFGNGVDLVEGFLGKVKSTLDPIVALRKEAAKLGTDTKSLGGLMAAAGSDTDAMSTGLKKMQATLGAALNEPAGEAAKAFGRLGLSAKDLAGMPLQERFLKVADAIKGAGSSALQARAAVDLLGRGGQELLPVMLRGGEAIRAEIEKADRQGRLLTQGQANVAAEAAKAFKGMEKAVEGVWTQVAVNLSPAIATLAEQFGGLDLHAKDWGEAAGEAAGAVAERLLFLKFAAGEALDVLGKVGANLPGAGLAAKGAGALPAGVLPGKGALFGGGAGAFAGPQGMIAGAMFGDAALKWWDANAAGIAAVVPGVKALHDRQDELKKKLAETAAAFGATDMEAQNFAAAMQDVARAAQMLNAAQTPWEKWTTQSAELSQMMQKGIINFEEYARLLEHTDFGKAAKGLTDSLRTPMQLFEAEMGRLRELVKADLLDPADMERLAGQAADKFFPKDTHRDVVPRFAGAALAGSQEALRTEAFTEALGKGGGGQDNVQQRMLKAQEKANEIAAQQLQVGRDSLKAQQKMLDGGLIQMAELPF